ncbi:MAG: hypothetical protein ABI625_14590 [bacterium]
MPIPRESYEAMIARSEADHRAAQRETTRDLLKTCGHLIFWVLAGWVFIGLSAYTSNATVGRVFYWAGFSIWVPGVGFSLLAAYRRGEKRGDW